MVQQFVHVLLVLLLVPVCTCAFYRGGTINWAYQEDGTVKFSYRLGFEYGSNGCNETNSGSYMTSLASETWQCSSGCNGTTVVGDNSYFCADADVTENWEVGEKTITFTPATKRFTVRYSGGPWMLLGYGMPGDWSIETEVDIRNRSDIGAPNSSPVTAALPIYSVKTGCTEIISIPVYDVENDVIRCRWAQGVECGDTCDNVTSSLPAGSLDPNTCILTVNPVLTNGFVVGLYYLVAIVIEDRPSVPVFLDGQLVHTNESLSGTPLQFLLYVENTTSTCTDRPQIIDSPPSGAEYVVPVPYAWTQRIYVQMDGGNLPESVALSGPRGIQHTAFAADDKGRPSVFYTDVTWTSTQDNEGVTLVCTRIKDNQGLSSKQTCYTLLVGYTNPCASGPCVNQGTCNIDHTNYTCTCPPGVYGEHCEFDIDECQNDPCDNNALCQNYIGDYKCFCRQGYGGKNCSDGEFCLSNPCLGRGECVHNVTTFACNCFHGYSGPTCQINADDCLSSPCLNGGTCQDLVGDYLCTCLPEFTGKRCESEIDYCDPSPCKNGGICSLHTAGYACNCPDDVIGLNCELPIAQACDGDQSHCLCKINGEPVNVPIPDTFVDDEKERYLVSGIIGYPVGLVSGACLCALFHYFIRPRCSNKQGKKRPSSASSSATFSSSTMSTTDGSVLESSRASPPPRYSSLQYQTNC